MGEFFQAVGGAWTELQIDLTDLIAAGEHVVGVGRGEGTLAARGTAGYGFAQVFTLRDGKIVRFREYADPDQALR